MIIVGSMRFGERDVLLVFLDTVVAGESAISSSWQEIGAAYSGHELSTIGRWL